MNFLGFFKTGLNVPGACVKSMTDHSIAFTDGEHESLTSGHSKVVFWGRIYDYQGKNGNNSDNRKFYSSELLREMSMNGIGSITGLDGKFICIIDTPDRILLIRDYFGSGPQVYYNDTFFSNSLHLIRESGLIPFEPEIGSIARFLKYGFIAAPDTAIKGIRKLAPGEYLEYVKREHNLFVRSILSYEKFSSDAGVSKLSLQDSIAEYSRLHRNSIQKRINGSDQVAVLLSGGFDSGGNLSVLRDLFSGNITAYSAGFENNPWSELPYARLMADKFNAKHEIHFLGEDDLNALPSVIRQLGDPFFENGLLLNYKISKGMSQSSPSVILGGDGNDQLFGTSGRELALLSLSRKLRLGFAQRSIDRITEMDKSMFRLGFHNKSILNAPYLKEFGFSVQEINRLFNSEFNISGVFNSHNSGSEALTDFNDLYNWRNYNSDIMLSAGQVIIYKASQLAMMHNLDLTFPYIDKEIFSFLQKLPREIKFYGSFLEIIKGHGKGKYLFIQYLKNKLPVEITSRKKQGGFAPLSIFIDNRETRRNIYNLIEITLAGSGLFKENELKQFSALVESVNTDTDLWFWFKQAKLNQLFSLLTLSIWWKQYIDGDIRETLPDYYEKS